MDHVLQTLGWQDLVAAFGMILFPLGFVILLYVFKQLAPRLVPSGNFGIPLWILLTIFLFLAGIRVAEEYFEARTAGFPASDPLILDA